MDSKAIWRRSKKIVEGQLPDDIAWRDLEDQEDYGVDAEGEQIGPRGVATGLVFKAQLKGSKRVTLRAGRPVLGGLRVDRAEYAVRYRIPFVLFLVDLATQRVFWTVAQLDDELRATVAEARAAERNTLTISMPVANVLSRTLPALLRAVAVTRERIALDSVRDGSAADLREVAANLKPDDLEDYRRAFKRQEAQLALLGFDQLAARGALDEVVVQARAYLDSPSQPVELRVQFGLEMLRTVVRMGPEAGQRFAAVRDEVTRKLLAVCRPRAIDRQFQVFAVYLRRWERLGRLIEEFVPLAQARTFQRAMGSIGFGAELTEARLSLVVAIMTELLVGLQWSLLRVARRGPNLVPAAWLMSSSDLASAHMWVRKIGLDAHADRILYWASSARDMAVDIAVLQRDWDMTSMITTTWVGFAALDTERFETCRSWCRSTIERIPEGPARNDAKVSLDEMESTIQGVMDQMKAGKRAAPAQLRTHIRQGAVAFGVDLDNPKNDLDRHVIAALEDSDSSVYLRTCSHLELDHAHSGLVSDLFGLATRHRVRCSKHPGREAEHARLGIAFDTFSKKWCETCADRSPVT